MAPRRKTRAPRRKNRRTNRRGKMASNTKVLESVKYRVQVPVTTATSATGVGQYVFQTYTTQNSLYTNVAGSPEFAAQKSLYDEMCVTSCKVTYRPFYDNVAPGNSTTSSSGVGYVWIDRDGNAPVATSIGVPIKLQAYDSCKVVRLNRPWSRMIRTKGKFWTDVNIPTIQSSVTGSSQPWVNAGALQMLGFYAEKIPLTAGQALGDITVEWNVQFRGKKPVAFSFDSVSGSVILTPLSSYPQLTPTNQPLLVIDSEAQIVCVDGIPQFQDLSGNPLTVPE